MIIILIFVALIVLCLIYDNTLMSEGFFVPVSSGGASRVANNNALTGGARVKSAHELMQSERKFTTDNNIGSKQFLSSNNRILTAAAAVAMLNSNSLPDKKRYRSEMIEGFENPTKSNCLLPLPLPNNNSNKNKTYPPIEYNIYGKPAQFDMVEQPIDPKYPMLVLP